MSGALNLLLLLPLLFVASFLMTRLVRRTARRHGWVAMPRAQRWHREPVALHGGVGFFPPFLLFALWYLFPAPTDPEVFWSGLLSPSPGVRQGLAMLAGGALMFICGLWDDFRPITPTTKFVSQTAAASIVVFFGGVFPVTGQPAVDVCITYLWFVGITNAVNLLDNMDGLASGTGILACVFIAAAGFGCAGPGAPGAVLALLLAVALLGYWLHNRHPASIFMGDSGSLSLGFCLAALALPGPLNNYLCLQPEGFSVQGLSVLLVPVLLLAVPIFDTTFVTFTRIMSARNVHEGSCDHTSHRLVRLGLSETRAVLLLQLLGTAGGAAALLVQGSVEQALPLFGLFILLLFSLGAYLAQVTVERTRQSKTSLWVVFVQGLLLKRNIAGVLLDTVMIVSCYWGAYLLRFDFHLEPFLRQALIESLPLVVACSLLGLRLAGAYGATWRLASVSDVPGYAFGALLGTSLSFTLTTLLSRFGEGYSRSAFMIYGFLFFLAVTISRQSFLFLDNAVKSYNLARGREARLPVLIYGAGKGGLILLEESRSNPVLQEYGVLGFIDDNSALAGHKVGGLPVRDVALWSKELELAPEIWISSKSITDEQARALAAAWSPAAPLRRLALHLKELPGPIAKIPRGAEERGGRAGGPCN